MRQRKGIQEQNNVRCVMNIMNIVFCITEKKILNPEYNMLHIKKWAFRYWFFSSNVDIFHFISLRLRHTFPLRQPIAAQRLPPRRRHSHGSTEKALASGLQSLTGVRVGTPLRTTTLPIRTGTIRAGKKLKTHRDSGQNLVSKSSLQNQTETNPTARGSNIECHQTGSGTGPCARGWLIRSGGCASWPTALRLRIGSSSFERVSASGENILIRS